MAGAPHRERGEPALRGGRDAQAPVEGEEDVGGPGGPGRPGDEVRLVRGDDRPGCRDDRGEHLEVVVGRRDEGQLAVRHPQPELRAPLDVHAGDHPAGRSTEGHRRSER
ncbi:hypothetical protein WCD58_30725 [Actinomycetospora sp. OC33-EN07]|uniref:Uncharacterized protein n=1 Tax=Actinomycetospora flava TaxID=3129232 RepID=A0ABU8MGM8_9PSEU